MRVVVLGGGIVGVTTAYYLAKDGCEVVLVDRQDEVAAETSFANAGIVAPGHAKAWASPAAPMILLKSLWRDDTALRYRLRADPRMWAWSLRFLMNCTAARNRANTLVKLKLCLYSAGLIKETAEELGIAYDAQEHGALYLHRSAASLEVARASFEAMRADGLAFEVADPDRCVELEPALESARGKLAGGVHAPEDFSGDCHLFAKGLAEYCRNELGVEFRMDETVTGLDLSGKLAAAVTEKNGNRDRVEGDHIVLALGSYAPFLTRQVGIGLPVYPVKGYSLTLPVGGHNGAPRGTGVDEHYLVAYTRMGERLRLTATADFAGYDTNHKPEDFATMLKVARDLFPDGADFDKPSYWACLRPMTPDGPPVLGATKHRNLWLNAGHGHMGWTMASGSSRIVADLVQGHTPQHPVAGMELGRY